MRNCYQSADVENVVFEDKYFKTTVYYLRHFVYFGPFSQPKPECSHCDISNSETETSSSSPRLRSGGVDKKNGRDQLTPLKGMYFSCFVFGHQLKVEFSMKFTSRDLSLKRTPSKKQSGVFGVKINVVTKYVGSCSEVQAVVLEIRGQINKNKV